MRSDDDFDVGAAAAVLRERIGEEPPDALLILGSGLSDIAGSAEDPVEVPFPELPGFPGAGVRGHAGRYVAGRLEGRRVLVQAGRFHVYEGHPLDVVCAPTRVASALGIGTLLVTNAAGSLHRRVRPGSIVLLDDHLNFMFRSPLAGPVLPGEERFPDMSAPYDPALQELALESARELGIELQRGTYVAVTGPSYETPAEIRMLGRLGATVVGMSTVPEVVTAAARGMRCLGFSMVTNYGSGLGSEPLSHDEVVATGREAGGTLERLVRRIVRDLP